MNRALLAIALAASAISCHAQTVYDARRQFLGSLMNSECQGLAVIGAQIVQARDQKHISENVMKEKLMNSNQVNSNPDLLNLMLGMVDAVYPRARTEEDGKVMAQEYCIQNLSPSVDGN